MFIIFWLGTEEILTLEQTDGVSKLLLAVDKASQLRGRSQSMKNISECVTLQK